MDAALDRGGIFGGGSEFGALCIPDAIVLICVRVGDREGAGSKMI
mgnify:CR=1 FL=1